MKKTYLSPDLEVIQIFSESSIAAGSALVTPVNSQQVILDQWDEESQERTYTW